MAPCHTQLTLRGSPQGRPTNVYPEWCLTTHFHIHLVQSRISEAEQVANGTHVGKVSENKMEWKCYVFQTPGPLMLYQDALTSLTNWESSSQFSEFQHHNTIAHRPEWIIFLNVNLFKLSLGLVHTRQCFALEHLSKLLREWIWTGLYHNDWNNTSKKNWNIGEIFSCFCGKQKQIDLV